MIQGQKEVLPAALKEDAVLSKHFADQLERTALGPQSAWPPILQSMALTCLQASFPMSLFWGESMVPVYNRAFNDFFGLSASDPTTLSLEGIFNHSADEVEAAMKDVWAHRRATSIKGKSMAIQATGNTEPRSCVYLLSPVYDEDQNIAGVLVLLLPDDPVPAQNTDGIDKLKRTEDQYHKMIDEINEYAIILLDKDGIIQNWNQGAEKIKGYRESEIVGKHFGIFYLPEDRASGLPRKLLNKARTTGKAIHEGWRVRKDKTRFWGSITLTALHDDNGEVIGFSKVTRDLTEKKLADDQLKKFAEELQQRNEELRSSEEQYHRMIAEVEDYAILLLDGKGNIQNWNVGAEKIKGYTAEEIIGKNFRIFYPEADKVNGLPEKLLAQAATRGKATHEGWRVRKDGSMFWGNIVITALHSSNGAVIGFSKFTRDLTERKRTEDKLKEYLEELEAQNKELEQFAYVASHDLQEPLRKIRTFADMIAQHLDDEALTVKYLQKINVSAQRMTELIRSVLNYSRLAKEGEEDTLVDLNQVIDNVLGDYELLVQEKNASLIVGQLPLIKGIALQLNQLLSNLVGNALKFSDKAPVIKISCAIVDKQEMALPMAGEETYLKISVEDNGIGFDQQYERLIFSMFQRLHAKHEYSGTGIGLALCKKIMDNHEGFIKAQGVPGQGATFHLYFPTSRLQHQDSMMVTS